MYLITGKGIEFIFREEFEDLTVSEAAKNAFYGGAAGAIYKSTRGFRPMVLSTLLGASLGTTYAYAW